MIYQLFKKFSGGMGAIFLLASTGAVLAQLPPLSPNQTDLLNNFRRNYGESPFLIQRDEPLENPSEGFKREKPVLQNSTTPPIDRPFVEVSEREFQEICRSSRQAANLIHTSDGRSLLVGCENKRPSSH